MKGLLAVLINAKYPLVFGRLKDIYNGEIKTTQLFYRDRHFKIFPGKHDTVILDDIS